MITPAEFVAKFEAVLSQPEYRSGLSDNWRNGKQWGKVLCGDEAGVLCLVATALKLKYKSEYMKIDGVMLTSVEIGGHSVDSLAVALEDEGLAAHSTWEMNKLALLDVPLKVLITYPKKNKEHLTQDSLLNHYAAVLQALNAFGDLGNRAAYLVIFAGRDEEKVIHWEYFEYFDHGFRSVPRV